MGVTVHESGFLDMSQTRALVQHRMEELDKKPDIETWDELANLTDNLYLRIFAMSTLFWVMGTIFLCIWHTVQHARGVTSWYEHPKRDNTLFVLGLPAAYCYMSFKSVHHILQAVLNEPIGLDNITSWKERMVIYLEMWESCFMVGDFYEAMAMYIFAALTLKVIREKVELIGAQADARRHRVRPSRRSTSEIELCKIRSYTTNRLTHALQSLTTIGIKYFCVSCFCQAFYYLVKTSRDYVGVGRPMSEATDSKIQNIFTGMGTISSCAAIENIIVVEHSFGKSHLKAFSPAKKFWSVKVLVSFAFLQRLALEWLPFSYKSELKQKLFFSCLICCECFFIAIGHGTAWRPDEPWYGNEESGESDESELAETGNGEVELASVDLKEISGGDRVELRRDSKMMHW